MISLAVDGVLAVLILMSIISWSIWVIKLWRIKKTHASNVAFEKKYFNQPDPAQKLLLCQADTCEYAQMALIGLQSQSVHRSSAFDLLECRDTAERGVAQISENILASHESGLSELGTISTLAPFVGLFGTVWGIMDALKTIAASGNATIESVSGPVGESLISTAIGILVAIPASAFFNHVSRLIKLRSIRLNGFGEQIIKDVSSGEGGNSIQSS